MDIPSTMNQRHGARWSDENVLRLHCNESPYGPPPGVIEAAERELTDGCAMYPDSQCTELRDRVAVQMHLTPDMVLIGNGVDELIMSTALTFVRRGESALMTESTFPGYAMSCTVAGGQPRTVPLDGHRISAAEVCKTLNGDDKLLFVCNPNNPTGTVLDPADVDRIITDADAAGVIPVFDEAYMEFAGPEYEYAIKAIRTGRRLLVLRTFSKVWGLASLRIGYLLGPSSLVDQVRETRKAIPFNVNRIAQRAAIAALGHAGFPTDIRERTGEARARLYKGLELAGADFVESATNFVLVRTRHDSAELANLLAVEHNVLVRDLGALGMPGCLRVTVGTPTQVDRFCTALAAALSSQRSAGLNAGLGSPEAVDVPSLTPVDTAALFNGFVGANVVFALNELGVWEKLLDGAQLVDTMAGETGADTVKLRALLRAATLLGYVDIDADVAALTRAGRDLVAQRGFFTWAVGGNGELFRGMADLTTGAATFGREVNRISEKVAEGSGLLGKVLLRPVEEDFTTGLEFDAVADLGCGDGSRLVGLCGATAHRRGVGIEASRAACEAAHKQVAHAGLGERIEIIDDEVLHQLGRRSFPGIDLVTCFLMLHDLFAEVGDAHRVVRMLLDGFPDAGWFLIADTCAQEWQRQDAGIPMFSLGFELVHAFMDVPITREGTYLEAFDSAGLRIERRAPFGSTSTWLYLLARDGVSISGRKSEVIQRSAYPAE